MSVKMSKLQLLRQFLNERLMVATDEIFGAVERIVLDLQDEVSHAKEETERQRRLLDAVIKPDLILHRITLDPQQAVPPVSSVVEERHPEQQQEPWVRIVQEPPQPPHIKQEDDLWTSQEEHFERLDRAAASLVSAPHVDNDPNPAVRVQAGPPHHSPVVENRHGTNTIRDTDTDRMGFEPISDDSPNVSAPNTDISIEGGNVCGRGIKYRDIFKNHKLIHTGENPYPYRGHLNRHRMRQRGEKSFRGQGHGLGFPRRANLPLYKAKPDAAQSYQCKDCSCCFESKASLDNHSRTHTMEKPPQSAKGQCEQKPQELDFDVCLVQENPESTQVKEEVDLWVSLEEEGEGQFGGQDTTVPLVPPPYVGRGSDGLHHSPMVTNRHGTNTSRDIYSEHAGFEAHNNSQNISATFPGGFTEEQFQCRVCGKRFKYKGNLKCHELIHTGEKPYKCKECNLNFRYKGHLNRHMRVHTGEKPYKCGVCGKSFTRNESLTFHIEHQHRELGFVIHQQDTNFLQIQSQSENIWSGVDVGQLSGLGTSTTDSILPPPCVEIYDEEDPPQPSHHFQSPSVESRLYPNSDRDTREQGNGELDTQHSSGPNPPTETPYQCEYCGKYFKYKCNFNAHKLIHTGEKPYKCKVCGLSFRYKGHLNRHQRVHTGEKPYTCRICGKTFTRKESLTFHKASHSENDHISAKIAENSPGFSGPFYF